MIDAEELADFMLGMFYLLILFVITSILLAMSALAWKLVLS
jgi:hypothetical protein